MSSSDWYKDIPLSLKIHGDMNAKTVCPLSGSVDGLGLMFLSHLTTSQIQYRTKLGLKWF